MSLALLVGACGYAGYVTSTNQVNKSRALAWEAKAVLLQSNVQRLEVKIASRTRSLNHRTSLLNSLLAKLSHARAEINSSQSDVNTLESRQRALADEKAKVEDKGPPPSKKPRRWPRKRARSATSPPPTSVATSNCSNSARTL